MSYVSTFFWNDFLYNMYFQWGTYGLTWEKYWDLSKSFEYMVVGTWHKGIPREMELVEVYNFSHEIYWLPYKRNACYELTFVYILFTMLMMMSFWICDCSHAYLDKSRHVRFHYVIHLEDIDVSQHVDVDRFCLSYPR